MAEVTLSYKEDIKTVSFMKLPWEKLNGTNILITGSTGLIGGCLVDVLMTRTDNRFQVFAAGRNKERVRKRFRQYLTSKSFHYLKYDVLSPLTCNNRFDYIIHAASNASPNFFAKNPVEVMKSNIAGTVNLMEYGLRHGMKRMLFVSTGEVYGEGDGRVFNEDYSGYVNPTLPRSCYPMSKRAAETLCVSYAQEYGADVVIARPCHIYGPGFTETDNRVYAQFIRNVLKGEDIIMKSSGEQFRSWCYVVDCVAALLYILLKGESCQAYNVADKSTNITIKELAEMVAEIGGRNVVLDLPNEDESRGFNVVTKSVFSTEKLESLGWKVLPRSMKEKMTSTIIQQELLCNN